jgi:integrase
VRGSIRVNQGKRGKSYSVVIDVPSADGRRRQHRRTFPTRKLAQEYLAKTLGEVYGGVYVAPSGQTVAAYLDEWLRTVSTGTTLSPATLLNYEKAIRRLVPLIGGVRLDRLDQMRIQRAYGELAGRYAASTVALTHACLSKALRQAVGWRRLARNPLDGVSVPSHPKSSAEAWSAEQAGRFLAGIAGDALRPLFALALWTGMREGELLALTWADVDLDGALLTVRRTVSVGRDRKEFVRPGTKGGPGRRVSLGPEAVSLLRSIVPPSQEDGKGANHRLVQRRGGLGADVLVGDADRRYRDLIAVIPTMGRAADGDVPSVVPNLLHEGRGVGPRKPVARDILRVIEKHESSWVFCRADGSRVSGVQARMRLLRLVRRLGLPEIGFHGLRHTHATLGLEAGVHPKVMAERLGHRTVGITLDVYSHVTQGLDQRAAEAVERRLAG